MSPDRARSSADRPDHPPLSARPGEVGPPGNGLMATEADTRFDQLEEAPPGSWLVVDAPQEAIPDGAMSPIAAMRLVTNEPRRGRNPRAQPGYLRHHLDGAGGPGGDRREPAPNFIDHAEYLMTAEIEQRCIRMLAELFHAPGETTGARTQGSSEAIMLGALSLKWKWRERRKAAGKSTDRPNLVFGGDVHVVWEKFAATSTSSRASFPCRPGSTRSDPRTSSPIWTRTRSASLPWSARPSPVTPMTWWGSTSCSSDSRREGHRHPAHIDGASGAFVWPFLYPDSKWDFRLEQVRSINASGHKFGLVYPGIGWLIFREKSDLAEDLVFYENYLGRPTQPSRSTSRPAPRWCWPSTTTSSASGRRAIG